MEAAGLPPSPQKITEPLIRVFSSVALLTALQLELFTALGTDSLTVEELALRMVVAHRRLRAVLTSLVNLGLMEFKDNHYTNGPEALHFLIKGKPSYIGGNHELYSDLYRAVFATAQSVKEDQPTAFHDFAAMTDDDLRAFFRGLHGFGVIHGRELANRFHWDRFESLADVGGGSGNVAIGACQAIPQLRAAVLELDRVRNIAEHFIADAGLSSRVRTLNCDIVRAPPPEHFDVAVLRNFVQVLSSDDAAAAICNTAKSLRPGGEIYIVGYMSDDDRREPWEAVAYDLVFANIYRDGQTYTTSEYRAWLGAAGLVDIKFELLPNKMTLITARTA